MIPFFDREELEELRKRGFRIGVLTGIWLCLRSTFSYIYINHIIIYFNVGIDILRTLNIYICCNLMVTYEQ